MRNCFDQGQFIEGDMACISGMAEICPISEQILITGEIAAERLGDEGLFSICRWNNVAKAPLFLLTDRQTVVMTRYEPQTIGRNLTPNRRAELFIVERGRFGVRYWSPQWPSFYEGVFTLNKMFGKYVLLDNWQDTVYINAILLLRKTCAFGIRMTQFFSNFSFNNVKLHSLSKEQEDELNEIKSVEEELLTNDELEFLSGLFLNERPEQKIINFPVDKASFLCKHIQVG
jgi:hypothetical protein